MTDEAKEEKAAPEEEVKEQAQAPEEEAPKPKVLKGSHKKVTRMSLDEVNEAIAALEQQMGPGHHSHHARTLLAQKAALMKYGDKSHRKAA